MQVFEARDQVGGGCRTKALTLPGYLHDVCAAIHPLGIASAFFRGLPLADLGVHWIQPPVPLAHPLDDGTAVILHRSVDDTAAGLGVDQVAYRMLMNPIVNNYNTLLADFLGPLRIPSHPVGFVGFGALALQPATMFGNLAFHGTRARAIFTGMAAHSILPLTRPPTAAFGLMLGMLAHAVGWPMVKGGSQVLADAMATYLRQLGGMIHTNYPVNDLDSLPSHAGAVLFDTTPRQMLRIAGKHLPADYQAQLAKYRYGPGVFKVDFALDGPIPWTAKECELAGTVHVGGTMNEIVHSENEIWQGRHPEEPFVLVGQLSRFDSTRAPSGKHTIWTYCHVPNGSTEDMTDRIEAQIERFAPGFRNRILARSTMSAVQMETYNPNYIGGDINAGTQDLRQFFTRPAIRLDPYSTPNRRLFICSSATPPGGGVHGMCGFFAARSVLNRT